MLFAQIKHFTHIEIGMIPDIKFANAQIFKILFLALGTIFIICKIHGLSSDSIVVLREISLV